MPGPGSAPLRRAQPREIGLPERRRDAVFAAPSRAFAGRKEAASLIATTTHRHKEYASF